VKAWLQQHQLEDVEAALQQLGVKTVLQLAWIEQEVGARPRPWLRRHSCSLGTLDRVLRVLKLCSLVPVFASGCLQRGAGTNLSPAEGCWDENGFGTRLVRIADKRPLPNCLASKSGFT
jgi:hypothetical protein